MGGDEQAKNRGHRATIGAGGDAKGSGAGAGGAGGPEDYDTDAQSGDGKAHLPTDKPDDVKPSHN